MLSNSTPIALISSQSVRTRVRVALSRSTPARRKSRSVLKTARCVSASCRETSSAATASYSLRFRLNSVSSFFAYWYALSAASRMLASGLVLSASSPCEASSAMFMYSSLNGSSVLPIVLAPSTDRTSERSARARLRRLAVSPARSSGVLANRIVGSVKGVSCMVLPRGRAPFRTDISTLPRRVGPSATHPTRGARFRSEEDSRPLPSVGEGLPKGVQERVLLHELLVELVRADPREVGRSLDLDAPVDHDRGDRADAIAPPGVLMGVRLACEVPLDEFAGPTLARLHEVERFPAERAAPGEHFDPVRHAGAIGPRGQERFGGLQYAYVFPTGSRAGGWSQYGLVVRYRSFASYKSA